MFLSLINHIRASNWTTLLVELGVVVLGVYGAFELERWGEERRQSKDEIALLTQLHSEILLADPIARDQAQNAAIELEETKEALQVLMRAVGSGSLTDEQCSSLMSISILRWSPLSLTAMTEMVSSGKHSQLADRQLKSLLYTLQAKIQDLALFDQMARQQQVILMDVYPELMPRGINESGENFMVCQTDDMRENQGFINHIVSNLGRSRGVSARLSRRLDAMSDVHAKLDELLEIWHSD